MFDRTCSVEADESARLFFFEVSRTAEVSEEGKVRRKGLVGVFFNDESELWNIATRLATTIRSTQDPTTEATENRLCCLLGIILYTEKSFKML